MLGPRAIPSSRVNLVLERALQDVKAAGGSSLRQRLEQKGIAWTHLARSA